MVGRVRKGTRFARADVFLGVHHHPSASSAPLLRVVRVVVNAGTP